MKTTDKLAVAYDLRQQGKTYSEIGIALGVSRERARQLANQHANPPTPLKRGRRELGEAKRQVINARLPQIVIESLRRAADENGTTITDEIEARIVETLMADGFLNRITVRDTCGSYTVASVMCS